MSQRQSQRGEATVRLTFLVDVDNTLLDNDAAKLEIDRRLQESLGEAEAARFWLHYEEVRRDTGVVSYPLTLARFAEDARAHRLIDKVGGEGAFRSGCQALADRLMLFPYERFIYPGALPALAWLRGQGRVAILSDGDPIYQPLKIARSGLASAVDNFVLVFAHKEEHLREVTAAFASDHYVLVEDKPAVISKVRARLAAPLTTVHVRQGKYAAQAESLPWAGADLTVASIGDLRGRLAGEFVAAAGRALLPASA